MFRFLLVVAIIGGAAYYLFNKIEADKRHDTNSVKSMEVNQDSSAARKIIHGIANEPNLNK